MFVGMQRALRGTAHTLLRHQRCISTQNTFYPELIIFDKSGTLIDFNLMWVSWIERQAWRIESNTGLPVREEIFRKVGYDMNLRRVSPHGALTSAPLHGIARLMADALESAGMAADDAAAAVDDGWDVPDPVSTMMPLADVPRIFSSLRGLGVKIAVCTADNRAATKRSLEALGVGMRPEDPVATDPVVADRTRGPCADPDPRQLKSGYVDALACGDDPHITRTKPAPDALLYICDTLDVPPANAIFVGDTAVDMEMGVAAGVGLTVGVIHEGGASHYEALGPSADLLIPDLDKLPKLVFQYRMAGGSR
jgi:phosphoglycolate phosphatase-like HAD superfamily hydrolase